MVLPHIPADPASDCASPCSRLHHISAQSQLDQEDARHAANRPIWTADCSHDGGDHILALMADRTPKLSHLLCSRLHHSSAQSQLDQEDERHAANRPIWTADCSHDRGDHILALMVDWTPKLPHLPCSRLHHSSAQSHLDQEDVRQPANRPMWTAGCAHDGGDHILALIADRTQKMTHPTHPTQKLTQRAFQERFQQRSLSHWTQSHQTNQFHPSTFFRQHSKMIPTIKLDTPRLPRVFLVCFLVCGPNPKAGRISREIC
jgi:hypothetical protein